MKKTKKIIVKTIQIILILVILYNMYKIGSYYYGRYKADVLLKSVADKVSAIENEFEQLNIEKGKSPEELKREKKTQEKEMARKIIENLQDVNKDIKAYIKIPETKIDYPIAYYDNDHYLYLNIKEEWSLAGTLFIEEMNKPDFTDMNTTIYGHNMHYTPLDLSPMFKEIVEFVKQDYLDGRKNNYVEIYTEDGIRRYDIFSAYYTNAFDDYVVPNRKREDWVPYLNSIKEKSVTDFKPIREFTEGDHIITLSTCDLVTSEGRVVIHALERGD